MEIDEGFSGEDLLTMSEINPFLLMEKFKILLIESESKTLNIDNRNVSPDGIGTSLSSTNRNTFYTDLHKNTRVYRPDGILNLIFPSPDEEVVDGGIGLNKNGRDLLLYIFYRLQRNVDYIDLTQNKVCKIMDIKRCTLSKGIANLTDNMFIMRMKNERSKYWVNPFYIFCGDRKWMYNSVEDIAIVKIHKKRR